MEDFLDYLDLLVRKACSENALVCMYRFHIPLLRMKSKNHESCKVQVQQDYGSQTYTVDHLYQ